MSTALTDPGDRDYLRLHGNINPRGPIALAFALAQSLLATRDWYDDCQLFVRTALGCPGGAATAYQAWLAVPDGARHGFYNPPAGVPAFWRGGSNGDGHTALTVGDGTVWSTDIKRHGKIDKVAITEIHDKWGLEYLGWTESDNGVVVYTAPPGTHLTRT